MGKGMGKDIQDARGDALRRSVELVPDPDMLRARLRTFLTLSEMESLRAKVEEERAVQNELERRASDVRLRAEAAKELFASSVERTARAKAYKAFIEARGTRAHFEKWWPQVFQSVRANADVT